jgi:hypothetical protein
VAPAPSSSRSHPFTKELPPYRKPSHQLNPQAQAKLRAIYSNSTSNSIATQNKVVVELIRTAAGAINDQLRDRTERVERRRKKWDQGQHVEEQEEEETELAALQEKVNEMTKKLEESMRGVIDAGEAAKRVEECLAWVRENSARTQVQEYETQMSQRQSASQSQAPSQRRRGEDEDEDEEDEYENEGPTPGPTPLTQARVALTGPSEMFTSRLQRQKQEYLTISHQTRYSKHNSYIGFKSMVHDAQYGDSESAPPLPHPDTWFTERGSPAPGITATQGGEDDDDDIVVDRATVSTRCPITYQIFKEPYSSKKCPHSFEKTAILEMIRRSRTRSIECPVPGCQQVRTFTIPLSTRFEALLAN